MISGIRYQVILIEPPTSRLGITLAETLRSRLRDLGLDEPGIVRFFDTASCEQCDPRSPTVGVFFGSLVREPAAAVALQRLLDGAHVIIPVVDDLANFAALVPAALSRINGFTREPNDRKLDGLASLILEALNLLPDQRRLFISYRRRESRFVADQLCTALERKGYRVFLDTHSVRPGDDFQNELFHRLADTEVMLLLDTPGFMESRWTAEELAQASALAVGIVQVVWPRHVPSPTTDLCHRVYLNSLDFRLPMRAALGNRALRQVMKNVERMRARSLAARHANLVKEFCAAAHRAGWTTAVQIDRHILAASANRAPVAVVPAVGVPTAREYDLAARRLATTTSGQMGKTLLAYDDRGVRGEWLRHLEWLDQHLPVQSVRVTAAYEALRSL